MKWDCFEGIILPFHFIYFLLKVSRRNNYRGRSHGLKKGGGIIERREKSVKKEKRKGDKLKRNGDVESPLEERKLGNDNNAIKESDD